MLTIYQIDAFTDKLFAGNPAAVVPLESWPDDNVMQSIAAENNLAESAFMVPTDNAWELRWFTPTIEVPLCGHATLAAAHVVLTHLGHENSKSNDVHFQTRQSGILTVSRQSDGRLGMDFPVIAPRPVTGMDSGMNSGMDSIGSALGAIPAELHCGNVTDAESDTLYLAIFADESTVAALKPDMLKTAAIGCFGVIASAPGQTVDFVSRFFAPSVGIDEDPVTGGAHCLLTPYWSKRLGKSSLEARQISTRTGELTCELKKDRVMLIGSATDYMKGEIFV